MRPDVAAGLGVEHGEITAWVRDRIDGAADGDWLGYSYPVIADLNGNGKNDLLLQLDEAKEILNQLRDKIKKEGHLGFKLPSDLRNSITQIQNQQNRLFAKMNDLNKEIKDLNDTINIVCITKTLGIPKPADA